ncbi:hypothetical protein Pcinc_026426 [Petrolisthes cinctipes]|uniref:Uncharacterized protein n=1 Tax=Petrolisthes cinctipes TaxID=88211 RepID=A0AAE1F6W8_PETCI|nr:hypothetical protein Pcinc_026426 [Petrolisthes cinctipes]
MNLDVSSVPYLASPSVPSCRPRVSVNPDVSSCFFNLPLLLMPQLLLLRDNLLVSVDRGGASKFYGLGVPVGDTSPDVLDEAHHSPQRHHL